MRVAPVRIDCFSSESAGHRSQVLSEDRPDTHPLAVPVCYDAHYGDANNHVFLAYVAQTHFAPPEALPMPLVYHEMIVDALADLHSQFWDHPRLRHDIGTLERDGPAFSFAAASQH